MKTLVISTVGTSLLTNCIDQDIDPDNWLKRLQDTANYTEDEINKHCEDVLATITELNQRAEEKLYNKETEISEIRETCAELNGIYGLYDEKLEQGISDTHILITTDTAQGRITSKLIEKFLQDNKLKNTTTCIQPQLSLKSSTAFKEGMAKVIPYIRDTIEGFQKNQYQIYFNLVGGFKALQGYFNTIGMFYANEIIYVFEGSNEVIKIPRLPIKVDIEKIEPFKVQLAMMEQGDVYKSWEKLKDIPRDWLLEDGQEMTLSTWGQLIWSQCKEELLSNNLLKFPKISYKDSFIDDLKKIDNNLEEKLKLQEVIAKVAIFLQKSNGDTSPLKNDNGLQYDKYTNMKGDIAHFRVTKGIRVSCTSSNNNLLLHRYGKEPVVNKNPY
ncbi:hypothetical protein NIES267_25800 [Calothrix parasitica NIES-267]|uniref:CRISPR system ring nuclease SSO1393-like domain-containing protein n=1 Tax=Calothrix parasitica NIES-267 TaxID=1973488 RepID=A0A1Z4LPK4_9CYAN|nr:hypothetical protein NIES267_25800 [Calothrix parasitica NIES-267]